jgi:hypothetical protein
LEGIVAKIPWSRMFDPRLNVGEEVRQVESGGEEPPDRRRLSQGPKVGTIDSLGMQFKGPCAWVIINSRKLGGWVGIGHEGPHT